MSEPSPGPRHDPRLEAGGDDYPGVLPGPFDLIALERSRFGMRVAAPGLFLVLLGVVPAGDSAVLGGLLLGLRFLGWIFLAGAIALWAPTPNGPLPSWLKPLFVIACLAAAARVVYHRFWHVPDFDPVETRLVQAIWVVFLSLPWILWRFCQHRGLTGRALTWLWTALMLLTVFLVNLATRATWALYFCPIIGALLFVIARQTGRDLWLDAVYKNARAHTPRS